MNYRHAFHAGNFADVLKHVVVALCLERLNGKDKPWRYIDTHAGIGLYDLTGDEAMRSPEWEHGIGRVWTRIHAAPAEVQSAFAPLLHVLRRLNATSKLETYPGSPAIAQVMARSGDALRLCELHAESAELLGEALGRDRRIKLEQRDGYEALPAYLPPPERRGLVLIDPPFEEGRADNKKDFSWMLRAARKAVKRWPRGTFVFWRPLKDVDAVEQFDGDLATLVIEQLGLAPDKLMVADLWVRALGEGPLAGAGVVIVNPPFGLKEHLEAALPWLAQELDQTPDGVSSQAGWRLVAPEAEDQASEA